MMKAMKVWLAENRPEIQIPKERQIPFSWFSNNGLPAIVECKCCTTTMVLFSGHVDENGDIYCSDCSGDD